MYVLPLAVAAVGFIFLGAGTRPLASGAPYVDAPVAAAVEPAAGEVSLADLTEVGIAAQVDVGWLTTESAKTQIPPRALQAYAGAELALGRDNPSCHLSWNTLAAIGWIESGHGGHTDSVLNSDGTTSHPIIGPALDGSDGHSAIRATDATSRATGDPSWDHAVGPMQFIGSTWARWGEDASGDGFADPNNIDDASLTAGRYLCAGGRDLSTGEGWTKAIGSYNHSGSYIDAVRTAANDYAFK